MDKERQLDLLYANLLPSIQQHFPRKDVKDINSLNSIATEIQDSIFHSMRPGVIQNPSSTLFPEYQYKLKMKKQAYPRAKVSDMGCPTESEQASGKEDVPSEKRGAKSMVG